MARSSPLKRGHRIRRRSKRRATESAAYLERKGAFLWRHPLCQITLASNRLSEAALVAEYRAACRTGPIEVPVGGGFVRIEPATQIHHRNKSNGARFLNEDYWMAASPRGHDLAERHKAEARKIGVLCPINAAPDGRLPDGSRCLTTDELIAVRAKGYDDPASFL